MINKIIHFLYAIKFRVFDLNKIKGFYYYNPIIDKEIDFRKEESNKNREFGISGFMRLRNEEEFLGLAIESCIECLDELIIVYNNCTDSTPEIINRYKLEYPDKIKVFNYEPIVYPQGSKEYASLEYNSVHSLVNYYNFSLAQTTKKIVVKLDGDMVFSKKILQEQISIVKNSRNKNSLFYFQGINLYRGNTKKIEVFGENPLCGELGDIGFMHFNKNTFFIKTEIYEQLIPTLFIKDIGINSYHLKYLKKDYGLSNYQLEDNPESYYKKKYNNIIQKNIIESIPLKVFKEKNNIDNFPDPETLNIK